MRLDLNNLANDSGNDYHYGVIVWTQHRSCRGAIAATALFVASLSACGSAEISNGSSSNGAIRVVVTTSQLNDFANVIGGSDVKVYSLLKRNVDAHDFEPSPADLDAIANADVIIKNGVGLEIWFDDVVKSASPRGAIIDASIGVEIRDDDPHIWFDPQNAKLMVRNITAAFAVADANHANVYWLRETAYAKQIDALDVEIATKIDSMTNKKLVTNHDAFGYYVDRYGLEFVGSVIPSFDTNAEISASAMAELVNSVKSQGVKAIFAETSLPAKAAAALADEAGVKVVDGGDSLYGDALGLRGSIGDDYLSMMRHNTDTIVTNLK